MAGSVFHKRQAEALIVRYNALTHEADRNSEGKSLLELAQIHATLATVPDELSSEDWASTA